MSKGKSNSASELELADLLNDIKTADKSIITKPSDVEQISLEADQETEVVLSIEEPMQPKQAQVGKEQSKKSNTENLQETTNETQVTAVSSEGAIDEEVQDIETVSITEESMQKVQTQVAKKPSEKNNLENQQETTDEGQATIVSLEDVVDEEKNDTETVSSAEESAQPDQTQADENPSEKPNTENQQEIIDETQSTVDEAEDNKIVYQLVKRNNGKNIYDNTIVDLLIKRRSQYFHNNLSEEDIISIIELTQEFLFSDSKEERKYRSNTLKFSISQRKASGVCGFCAKEDSEFIIIKIGNKVYWFCEDCAKKFIFRFVKYASRNLDKKALEQIKQYFELNHILYANIKIFLLSTLIIDTSKKQEIPPQKPKVIDISKDKETEYQNKISNLQWQLKCVNNELLKYKRDNEKLRKEIQEQEGILFQIKQTLNIGKTKTKYVFSFLKDILAFLK